MRRRVPRGAADALHRGRRALTSRAAPSPTCCRYLERDIHVDRPRRRRQLGVQDAHLPGRGPRLVARDAAGEAGAVDRGSWRAYSWPAVRLASRPWSPSRRATTTGRSPRSGVPDPRRRFGASLHAGDNPTFVTAGPDHRSYGSPVAAVLDHAGRDEQDAVRRLPRLRAARGVLRPGDPRRQDRAVSSGRRGRAPPADVAPR